MFDDQAVFVTGGAGTLGRAIAERRKRDGWTGKLTVYSTSEHTHARMRSQYPDVNFVCGDIRNPETLYNAMVGHDIVIHAAAVKVIPVSEYDSIDTFDVNVNGSINVFSAALRANVKHVVSISTDKACHPANAYGATKMLMEKASQEYSKIGLAGYTSTQYNLVRYGNVLESTGSVVEAWHKAASEKKPIKITNPDMTRFWLSPAQAVDLVIKSLELKNGHIYVAKMPALSIGKLAEYTIGPDYQMEEIEMRPGEKMHETLLTVEETDYAIEYEDHFDVRPSTDARAPVIFANGGFFKGDILPYTSDVARELTKDELETLLGNQ